MHTTGMFFKAIRRQMGYHYTVVSRLVRKHTQTDNVKDLHHIVQDTMPNVIVDVGLPTVDV
jgi:hypothetical protein